jgi:tetratricopeptide (TPR) repeat protein
MSQVVSVVMVSVLLGLVGCAGKETNNIASVNREEKTRLQFERGLKALDEEKYREAARIFDNILVQSPAEEFDFVILYNLGAAHEGLKNCAAAAEKYKQVAQGSLKRFPRIEALSLLRLSYMYECLGQNDKVIVSLMDVRRRLKALPEDIAKSEVPARLAAAYARAGNRQVGEKYFREALNGIKFMQVKYKDSKTLADRLAEALFYMGRSMVGEKEFLLDPIGQVRGLELMQLYLLEAAELGSPKWSSRAVDEILSNYAKVWTFMEKLDVAEEDTALRRRQRDQLRVDVLKETMRSVRVLRAQRIPTRQETSEAKKLFQGLEQEERKITAMLSELGPHTDLTPQADRREGLRRQGRVRSERETELEKAKAP